MNAHIRDNLLYLKGQAGAVTIDDVIAPLGMAALRNDGGYQFTLERSSATARKYGFAIAAGDGSFAMDDVTAAARRMTLDVNGNLGFGGVLAPQGKIHVAGAGGGMLFLSCNAVDGTLQTPVVAGTVTQSAAFWGYDRNNTGGGLVQVSGNMLALAGTFAFINTDTVTVTVTAGGAITVQRTAGTNGTHQINMLVLFK